MPIGDGIEVGDADQGEAIAKAQQLAEAGQGLMNLCASLPQARIQWGEFHLLTMDESVKKSTKGLEATALAGSTGSALLPPAGTSSRGSRPPAMVISRIITAGLQLPGGLNHHTGQA